MRKISYWLLGLITLIAVFFRFYKIMEMPGGLFPDEAANGLDINLMEQGQIQPFYERGNGREALFFYMLWASIKIFGRGHWQHHIVSAGVGVLIVIATFFLTRALFQIGEKLDQTKKATAIGLIASFLVAVSVWPAVISRTAFRANLIPLFSLLTLHYLILTAQAASLKKRILWSALAGASFALGFYTYIAYRILAPVIVMIILWPLLVDLWRSPRFVWIKKFWPALISFSLAFIIFIFPIAKYFYEHEGSFVGRSSQVSVFNPELNKGDLPGTILEVLRVSMLGYFTQGDLNYRHNISGEPFVSHLVSPFFGAGLLLSLILAIIYFFLPHRFPEYWKHFVLTGWFWAMLLPVITTAEGIPHALRALGTLPPVFILTAWILYAAWEQLGRIVQHFLKFCKGWRAGFVRYSPWALVMALAIALPVQTYALYFIGAYNSPENFYAFRSDLTVVSNWLLTYGNKTNTYLVLDKFSVQTPDYLTTVDGSNPGNPKNQPYIQVDPENSWQLSGLKPGDRIVFTQSSIFDIKKFLMYHPNTKLTHSEQNKFGQWVLAVYTIQ